MLIQEVSGKAEVWAFSSPSATSKGLRLFCVVGVHVTLFPQLFNLLLIEYNVVRARSVQQKSAIFLRYDWLRFPVMTEFFSKNAVQLELWLQLIFHLDGQGKF